MTNQEVVKGLKSVLKMFTGYKPNEEMFDMTIKTLELQDIIINWLIETQDPPCQYKIKGVDASDYFDRYYKNWCEQNCGKPDIERECWIKFFEALK